MRKLVIKRWVCVYLALVSRREVEEVTELLELLYVFPEFFSLNCLNSIFKKVPKAFKGHKNIF